MGHNDMGLRNSPVVSQDRCRDDIYSSNVPLEAGSGNGVEETRSEEGSDNGEKDDDFELVVLTNQSSIPKGWFSLATESESESESES